VLLFSATLPSAVAEFTHIGLRSPELVRLDVDTKLSPDLKLLFFAMRHTDKPAALLQVLREFVPLESPTIVFAATKHRVEYLGLLLEQVIIKIPLSRFPCCDFRIRMWQETTWLHLQGCSTQCECKHSIVTTLAALLMPRFCGADCSQSADLSWHRRVLWELVSHRDAVT
jgi:hypothetical protein